jgi:acetylornithine/N-succinyldiaminopimelate aminotransferase
MSDDTASSKTPLIVNEAEIDHSIGCLERACAALSATEKKKAAG